MNKNGERFCNEMVYGATLGDAMCEDHNGKSYLVMDEALFKKAKEEATKALPFQRDAARMLMLFNAVKKKNIQDLAAKFIISTHRILKIQYNSTMALLLYHRVAI